VRADSLRLSCTSRWRLHDAIAAVAGADRSADESCAAPLRVPLTSPIIAPKANPFDFTTAGAAPPDVPGLKVR
jgi:hypothetical protein